MRVREDSEGKYVRSSEESSCSMRFRAMNSFRSSSISVRPDLLAINTWAKYGITALALAPMLDGSTGTSRQPSTSNCSSLAICEIERNAFARCCSSVGRKANPTPYPPIAGKGKPATSERKRCGIWMSTPAPSPVSASAPVAPRCSMLHNAPIPIDTMLCERRPCMSTTNETPQASCSNRGSYKPLAGGKRCCIVVLVNDQEAEKPARDDAGP